MSIKVYYQSAQISSRTILDRNGTNIGVVNGFNIDSLKNPSILDSVMFNSVLAIDNYGPFRISQVISGLRNTLVLAGAKFMSVTWADANMLSLGSKNIIDGKAKLIFPETAVGNQINYIILSSPTDFSDISLSYIFIGYPYTIPGALQSDYTIQENLRDNKGQTDFGIVYGRKLPSLRKISVSLQAITEIEKQSLLNYVNTVGTNIPHIVEWREGDLMMMTIDNLGTFKRSVQKKDCWDISITYLEAK